MSKRKKITFDVMTKDGKKQISFFPLKRKLIAKKGMNIVIHLTKDEINHILPTHTFYDCCGTVESIMLKLQKNIKLKHEEVQIK